MHVLATRFFCRTYFYRRNQEASVAQTLENLIPYSVIRTYHFPLLPSQYNLPQKTSTTNYVAHVENIAINQRKIFSTKKNRQRIFQDIKRRRITTYIVHYNFFFYSKGSNHNGISRCSTCSNLLLMFTKVMLEK